MPTGPAGLGDDHKHLFFITKVSVNHFIFKVVTQRLDGPIIVVKTINDVDFHYYTFPVMLMLIIWKSYLDV